MARVHRAEMKKEVESWIIRARPDPKSTPRKSGGYGDSTQIWRGVVRKTRKKRGTGLVGIIEFPGRRSCAAPWRPNALDSRSVRTTAPPARDRLSTLRTAEFGQE